MCLLICKAKLENKQKVENQTRPQQCMPYKYKYYYILCIYTVSIQVLGNGDNMVLNYQVVVMVYWYQHNMINLYK